jgi:hypothetical protein
MDNIKVIVPVDSALSKPQYIDRRSEGLLRSSYDNHGK